jgi:hypothetical protein
MEDIKISVINGSGNARTCHEINHKALYQGTFALSPGFNDPFENNHSV